MKTEKDTNTYRQYTNHLSLETVKTGSLVAIIRPFTSYQLEKLGNMSFKKIYLPEPVVVVPYASEMNLYP